MHNELPGLRCKLSSEARVLFHSWFLHVLHDYLKEDLDKEKAGDLVFDPPQEYMVVLPKKLSQAKNLVERIVDEFSPAVLVDGGPLGCLPTKYREVLKEAVHTQYLQMNFIQPRQHRMAELVRQIELNAEQLIGSCERETRLAIVPDLLAVIERLDDELSGDPPLLPDCIVLP